MEKLRQIKRLFLGALFPYICLPCKKETGATDENRWLCASCHKKLKPNWQTFCHVCGKEVRFGRRKSCAHEAPWLENVSTIFSYQDRTARKIIHAFKYNFVLEAAQIWQPFLRRERLNFLRIPTDLVVSLPLHRRKLRERGFNQAEIIARQVSELVQKPLVPGALLKRRSTSPQMKLKKPRQRQKNIRGVFTITDEVAIRDKEILLVDDVATTGSTLEEAARILKESGAKKVYGFVLAKD